jgi:lichenan operon transcriptional antiterminator
MDEAIYDMSSKLIDQGYVPQEFVDRLLERESISPTNFGMIAIPHPIDYYSSKSVIAVSILKSPVTWGNSDVRIIFMFTTNKKDIVDYSDVFPFLAEICSSEENIMQLIQSDSCDHFIELLTRLS